MKEHELVMSPRPVVVVTTQTDGWLNASPLSWSMPVSYSPPLVALSLKWWTHCLAMINTTRKFTVNVLPWDMGRQVQIIGLKWPEGKSEGTMAGLESYYPFPWWKEEGYPPAFRQAHGCFTCDKVELFETGDHALVIGQVAIRDPDMSVSMPREDQLKLTSMLYLPGRIFGRGSHWYEVPLLSMEEVEKEWRAAQSSEAPDARYPRT